MTLHAKRIADETELDKSCVCYWKLKDGTWLLYLPDCGVGNLCRHSVVEHDDGAITVTPSILVDGNYEGKPERRHGFLTKGIWSDCSDSLWSHKDA